MEINKIIKDRRIELGLTLKDVAKALNIAESTVCRYESSDIQNMGIDKIEALAKVLRCSPGYLMGWEEPPAEQEPAFSDLEKNIIISYRKADEATQITVRRILDVDVESPVRKKA